MWSLRDEDGWRLVGDDQGQQCMPVWPHERYAKACSTGEFSGCTAEPIPLDRWLDEWLPGARDRGWKIAVFPVSDAQERGVVVEPQLIDTDLRAELAQYE